MPLLTNAAAVQKIIVYDQTVVADLTDFLAIAVNLADTIIGNSIDNTTMEIVQRYLTAHFVALTDRQIVTEQVRSIQQTMESKIDLGLNLTRYGATAMLLDTSGKLAAHNQKVLDGIAGFTFLWCGKDNSENVTY